MKKIQYYFNFAFCMVLCFLTFSCSDDDGENFTPTHFEVNGKVEKGPFVRGSSINMQPADAHLNSVGNIFTATIKDDAGNFNFGSHEFDTPFAKLTANGYFFNEVNGELSAGVLNLNAIADLSDKQTINVNILTHLKYQRIVNLVTNGTPFSKANQQAQKELLSLFGLQRFADTDASQFSITMGTDEAGALIAVSSLILYKRSEAEITEYLSRLSSEFAESGSFSSTTMEQIKEDRNELNGILEKIADNIKKRYNESGQKIEVKDLAYFFDWDDDGIAGNEISGEDTSVILETTKLNVPKEGGKYAIKINSSISVKLTLPNGNYKPDNSIIESPMLYDTDPFSIHYDKIIENNTLKICVKPSSTRKKLDDVTYIYDYKGTMVAQLQIIQEGNENAKVPKLNDSGKSTVESFARYLSQVMTIFNQIDLCYTGILSDPYFKAPLSPSNYKLDDCWYHFYNTINYNRSIFNRDTEMAAAYPEFLNTFHALCYYNMVVYWKNVPYLTEPRVDFFNLSPISEQEIFEFLTANLNIAINYLEEKKNMFAIDDVHDFLFMSKDVARMVLADIYMYRKEYAKAKPLLEKIISNGFYQLEGFNDYREDSQELIFGLYKDNNYEIGSNDAIIPILTYTDVLLSLAECEMYLGNINNGKMYLKQVTDAKYLSSSEDLLIGIKEARAQLRTFNYFAFLKRNGLAKSELGLEDYQLLLPIPEPLTKYYGMTQNPGY